MVRFRPRHGGFIPLARARSFASPARREHETEIDFPLRGFPFHFDLTPQPPTHGTVPAREPQNTSFVQQVWSPLRLEPHVWNPTCVESGTPCARNPVREKPRVCGTPCVWKPMRVESHPRGSPCAWNSTCVEPAACGTTCARPCAWNPTRTPNSVISAGGAPPPPTTPNRPPSRTTTARRRRSNPRRGAPTRRS